MKHRYKPKLEYFKLLTTSRGILQHSSGAKPDPKYGYALDDNARALVATDLWFGAGYSSMKRYSEIYLDNIVHSQTEHGQMYSYSYDNGKRKQLGTGDWFGRSMVALAFHLSQQGPTLYKDRIFICLQRSLSLFLNEPERIKFFRQRSQLILASYYILSSSVKKTVITGTQETRLIEILSVWGKELSTSFDRYADDSWMWPENRLTYDNGKVIQAYFLLGKLLNNDKLVKTGQKILNWYLEQTMKNGYFQAPGNNKGKFWRKGEQMPLTDEQPIEACSLITALVSANKIKTANEVYGWYFGKNRLKLLMVDKLGGVYDGLRKKSVNPNRGAENVVGISLAYFAIKNKINL